MCKCGKCSRYMRYIPLKPQRLYCATCEETYQLPQNGTIKLYKELKCPLDNFELVLFSLGNADKAQGKSYPLCPYCYNHPPSFHTEDSFASGEGVMRGEEDGDGKGKGQGQVEGGGAVRAHMGCNSCLHPTCKQSAASLGICRYAKTELSDSNHGGR